MPTTKSLVPSGEASTSVTPPPPNVGRKFASTRPVSMLNAAREGWLYDVVLPAVLLRIEVNVPATKTRLPMYSRSQISPVVIERDVGPRNVVGEPGVPGHRLRAGGAGGCHRDRQGSLALGAGVGRRVDRIDRVGVGRTGNQGGARVGERGRGGRTDRRRAIVSVDPVGDREGGGAGSVDAAQVIWIVPAEGLVPAGRPGTLGAMLSVQRLTVIERDAWLLALALVAASTASTV